MSRKNTSMSSVYNYKDVGSMSFLDIPTWLEETLAEESLSCETNYAITTTTIIDDPITTNPSATTTATVTTPATTVQWRGDKRCGPKYPNSAGLPA